MSELSGMRRSSQLNSTEASLSLRRESLTQPASAAFHSQCCSWRPKQMGPLIVFFVLIWAAIKVELENIAQFFHLLYPILVLGVSLSKLFSWFFFFKKTLLLSLFLCSFQLQWKMSSGNILWYCAMLNLPCLEDHLKDGLCWILWKYLSPPFSLFSS